MDMWGMMDILHKYKKKEIKIYNKNLELQKGEGQIVN
jgi:hypothetical protein